MTKISSRDVLDILRRFEIANQENLPRQIEMIKIFHPSTTNTLVSFSFQKNKFYVLFDSIADDQLDYVISQIKSVQPNITGELLNNPSDTTQTYAIPFKNKDCYLFESTSQKRRLDLELAEKYPDLSRSVWQKHIKSGYVSVNNNVIRSTKYEIGDNDTIVVNLPKKKNYDNFELPIIYIDENVIVIDKPAGILTHSKGVLCEEFTVSDFFKRYSEYNSSTNRSGIIHRLDRDTSGILIGARNTETAALLQKQFSDRKTKKTYYAVVDGVPKYTIANIDVPIGRNPAHPSTFRVYSNGKAAFTKYEVISSSDNKSLVKLQPQTGRTHQLRVHMKHIGTPILGDKIYGKIGNRMYLHAYSLEITIPGGIRKVFVSPLPKDIIDMFPDVKLK